MLPAVLGTAAGAAAVTAGRGAAAALGNGLSFVAELAKAASGAASPESAGQPDSAGSAVKQRVAELTERIRRQLAAAGVKLTQSVELVSDGLGGVAVEGSHPQRSDIERAIGEDVLLERDFARLAVEYSELTMQHGADGRPAALTISITEPSTGGMTGRLPTGK